MPKGPWHGLGAMQGLYIPRDRQAAGTGCFWKQLPLKPLTVNQTLGSWRPQAQVQEDGNCYDSKKGTSQISGTLHLDFDTICIWLACPHARTRQAAKIMQALIVIKCSRTACMRSITCQSGLSLLSTILGSVKNSSFMTGGPDRMASTEGSTCASGS